MNIKKVTKTEKFTYLTVDDLPDWVVFQIDSNFEYKISNNIVIIKKR
jgi:hypothetical protein